jgi:hypothetical protein
MFLIQKNKQPCAETRDGRHAEHLLFLLDFSQNWNVMPSSSKTPPPPPNRSSSSVLLVVVLCEQNNTLKLVNAYLLYLFVTKSSTGLLRSLSSAK